jgi:hypothetical protein
MGNRSAHERWCSRNESLHYHRGRECTVASPAEPAARGPIKREICPGQDPRQTNEQTKLASEFLLNQHSPSTGAWPTRAWDNAT